MPARAVAETPLAGLLLVAAARGSLVDEVDALGDAGAPAGRAGSGAAAAPANKDAHRRQQRHHGPHSTHAKWPGRVAAAVEGLRIAG